MRDGEEMDMTSSEPESARAGKSRLTACCEGLIEACWLIAVAVVPLIYDPHAMSSFDPAKLAVLRALGFLTCAALLVRACGRPETGGRTGQAAWRGWMMPALVLLAAYLLASAFSVDPDLSLFGTQHYLQGTLTLFCLLSLFAGMAVILRQEEQMDRLVCAALAGGFPVALYALFQRAGLDPLLFGESEQAAFSFAGHPIFLAGYLLMLMPLCVWKLWRSCGPDGLQRISARSLGYAALLLVMLAAFVAADKRGPIVAMMFAIGCATGLLAAYWQRYRLVGRFLWLGGAAFFVLAALAVLVRAGVPIQDVPLVGRLALIVPVGDGTGDHFRSSLWADAPGVVMAKRAFLFPDGHMDVWAGLRPWIGHGPETLQGVLSQSWMYLWNGPAVKLESRFHNGLWDVWYSTGLLGVGAFAWFFCRNYLAGCECLGLAGWVARGRFFLAALTLAAGAGACLAALYGFGYFGMGFQLGFAAGLVAITLWIASRQAQPARSGDPHELLVVALLVGLLACWADSAFAFPMGNTTAVFWVFSGAVAGWFGRMRSGAENPEEAAFPHSTIAAGICAGLLSGVLLVALVHGFIGGSFSDVPVQAVSALGSAAEQRYGRHAGIVIPVLAGLTWLVSTTLIAGAFPQRGANRQGRLLVALAVSLSAGGGYAAWKAVQLGRIGPLPAEGDPLAGVLRQCAGFEVLGVVFLGVLLLVAAGLALMPGGARRAGGFAPSGPVPVAVAAVAILLLVPAVWHFSANVFRREALSRWAVALDVHGRKAHAAEVYLRGIAQNPEDAGNRLACAMAWMQLAERDGKPAPGLMERASTLLAEGRGFSELHFGNYFLGNIYLRRAMRETDPNARMVLGLLAKEAFVRAIRFAPQSEIAWFHASLVDRILLRDGKSADAKLRVADGLTARAPAPSANIDPAAWGDFYGSESSRAGNASLKAQYARRALNYYGRALGEDREALEEGTLDEAEFEKNQSNQYQTLLAMARLHQALGQTGAGVFRLLEAAETRSDLGTWEAEVQLANCYAASGDYSKALAFLDRAVAGAPTKELNELEAIRRKLESQRKSSGR